ncbi:DAL1_2 [Blepharisma stoltei]|uniref:Amidohydrolase-related domain-containing protein n=1 Tax=Blepharisma stoltei TaxID=1481888 RepID=A0AAU9IMD9_9CILI|nr:unnamed protein product [Blepharisma stoltei]
MSSQVYLTPNSLELSAQPTLKALYSKNIILEGKSSSIPGVIFINDEIISNIIELDGSNQSISNLQELYEEYEWEDLGDLYVSPGIIDLNVCFNNDNPIGTNDETIEYEGSAVSENSGCITSTSIEQWEGYEIGSRAAIAGGITTVIESPTITRSPLTTIHDFSHKLNSLEEISLYCDIGFLAHVDMNSLSEMEDLAKAGIMGFKGYLLPPSGDINFIPVEKLGVLYDSVARTGKPLFFHPEKTNERYLYMSSPFRKEGIENRQNIPQPEMTTFAGAFPEDIEPTSSDTSPISSNQSTPMRNTPSSDIKSEKYLERQLRYQSNNLESLIKAEMMTYSRSGFTVFQPAVSKITDFLEVSPEKAVSPFQIRSPNLTLFSRKSPIKPIITETNARQVRRPPPIMCKKAVIPMENSDYKTYLSNSPPHWEANGVQLLLSELAKNPNAKVHISNLSSANAVYIIRKAKRENPDLMVTCDTAGFYTHFSDEHIKDGDTRFKVNPPIREEKNRKLLLDVLRLGGIDILTSYHRPIKPFLKCLQKGDFKRAVSGISSIGLNLQCCWEALKGDPRIVAPKLAKILSQVPAEIIGISHIKGSIAINKHADLIVWDPEDQEAQTCIYMRHPQISPFKGEVLPGKIHMTYLRGSLVYKRGLFLANGKAL